MLRFAPSPTGDMHIGNLRVALFNYIVARQRGERFILRIEDTDRERNIEGKDREIVELLDLFGIEYDDLIYQSRNISFHQHFASKLLEEGKAFPCLCSEEELERERERAQKERRPYRYSGKCVDLSLEEAREKGGFAVRVKRPGEPISFRDLIKGELTFAPFDVDSFVIVRADGRPTYNFACAVDDMLSDITMVIRGEDHLSNTPKQIYIRRLLGYGKEITYAHLPIILNREGRKMSKREEASSVKWLLEEGFLPEAITNYLILLGNRTPTEIFTLEEAIGWFDLTKISRAPARFDLEKLRFINREHLKRRSPQELARLVGVHPSLGGLVELYLEEASTLKELRERVDRIFSGEREFGEFEEEGRVLARSIGEIGELPKDFGEFKRELMERSSLRGKRLFKPLRILLTGAPHGPELSELYPHLRDHIERIVR
ncbi:MAG: glutamate--tRNA ligase [Epsilonproteobacteria bacterium]|nr:glutamate--tRNA ligase [Campylobacterota bacterium]NPA57252.1 glutamate--tRNA ligase [Campylobacterota bacterium]